MGFLDKVKQFAGMGGIKLEIDAPDTFSKKDQKCNGKIIMTTKSDQHVNELKIELTETFTRKNGDQTDVKNYVLGSTTIAKDFDIKVGETKEFDFEFIFSFESYEEERLNEEVMGVQAINKLKGFMDGEKSVWHIEADASVKGAVLGNTANKSVVLK